MKNQTMYTKEVIFAKKDKEERAQIQKVTDFLLENLQHCEDKEKRKEFTKQIISNNLWVVGYVWRTQVSDYCAYLNIDDDVCQSGVIGLAKAIDHFSFNVGTSFSSYATKWILGEMMDTIYKSRIVKLPAHMENDIACVKKWITMKEQSGIHYSIEEIKEKAWQDLNVKMKNKKYRFERALNFIYTDTFKKGPYNYYEPLNITQIGTRYKTISQLIAKIDVQSLLKKANLSTDESQVIYKIFFENKTNKESAEEMGLSERKIKYLKSKSLKKLQKMAVA